MKFLSNPVLRLVFALHGVLLLQYENTIFEFTGLETFSRSLPPLLPIINSSDTDLSLCQWQRKGMKNQLA